MIFDLDNIKIIDCCSQWSKRLLLEAWHSIHEPNAIKVVALGNFKYFGIYFKMGYYLRISANKFESLSVTRIGTCLFYANIFMDLYL